MICLNPGRLEHCRKRIIIVGDTHQQIYSFRYAIDAMKRFPFDDERDLTMSFRFGRDIAEVASLLIQETKDEKGFKIRGNPEKSSRVAFYTDLQRPKAGERCAILSRTNLALFEKALGLRSRRIPFSLEGNISAILYRILDVYWLSPLILSTVHGAKGQEYARVYIDPDIAASLSRLEDFLTNAFGDEANIAYVGFTRAIRELHLPRDFKTILTPGWQETIQRYEPVQVSRTSKSSAAHRKRAPRPGLADTRYGKFTIEVSFPNPPRKKPFEIDDRVRTSHGTGTVVETDGEKYLVALDGQAARLWEKEGGIKRV